MRARSSLGDRGGPPALRRGDAERRLATLGSDSNRKTTSHSNGSSSSSSSSTTTNTNNTNDTTNNQNNDDIEVLNSEGGMIRLETLIELKFLDLSCSSFSSC